MTTIDPKHPKSVASAEAAECTPVDDVPALEAMLVSAPPEALATVEAAAPRKRRGFAAMDPALVREIARRGAQASHEKGTAHKFTADEARAAGRKGGSAPHRVRGRGKRTVERPGA